jgi:hypothetical protein
LDSLANESLIFTNAFANGRQSIHGMSSVLAGIPSLTDAFTSSPYSNQKFSQSFLYAMIWVMIRVFITVLQMDLWASGIWKYFGIQHYFGKNEYNNDEDFDGIWAIWDEPFFQYLQRV